MEQPGAAGPQPRPSSHEPPPAFAPHPQPHPSGYGPWQHFPPQPPPHQPHYPHPPAEQRQRAARRRRFTWSRLGLAVGLLGVVVQALFTYLVTFDPAAHGKWQPALDAGRTSNLVGDLDKMSTLPLWQRPFVLIVPFLPLLQMLVVIMLGIPRTRKVGPRLVSRGRIGWLLVFGVVTVYGAATTVVLGPAGVPQLLCYWLGSLVVIIGIALPHRTG